MTKKFVELVDIALRRGQPLNVRFELRGTLTGILFLQQTHHPRCITVQLYAITSGSWYGTVLGSVGGHYRSIASNSTQIQWRIDATAPVFDWTVWRRRYTDCGLACSRYARSTILHGWNLCLATALCAVRRLLRKQSTSNTAWPDALQWHKHGGYIFFIFIKWQNPFALSMKNNQTS